MRSTPSSICVILHIIKPNAYLFYYSFILFPTLTKHTDLDLCEVSVFITFAHSSTVSGYNRKFVLAYIHQIAAVIQKIFCHLLQLYQSS